MFVAGDDNDARKVVLGLASDIGFDSQDAGPLSQCRYLEPLAMLWITMSNKYGAGRNWAFAVVKR